MKIKEVASVTGLTEKTIRFYEEKQLITPEIHMVGERRFREYTEQNIKDLEEIATLRSLYFSLEEIRNMKENPDEIGAIMMTYKQRMEEEIEVKIQISDALKELNLTKDETISTIIDKIKPKAKNLSLPEEDINPDFRKLDRQNTALNLLVDRRIYTKHGMIAKKISDADVLILNIVWKKKEMNYNDILHVCAERGIKNQKYVSKIIKKLCHRGLLHLQDGNYHVEVDMPTLTESEVNRLVRGVVAGSPDLFVYTPDPAMGVGTTGTGIF